MKILAVETATSWQSVVIVEDDAVLARSDEDASGSHARLLVPAIDRVLASCGMELRDLSGLAVSIGPGSFTGLRVGLATMLGFRAVTGLPLAAVPTLEAMAWNLRGVTLPLCPVLRARTGEVYWAQYQWLPDGTLTHLQEEQAGTLDDLARSVRAPAMLFGEGWSLYKKELGRLLDGRATDTAGVPAVAMRPSAVSVGLAGAERIRKGQVAGPGLSPRYVQRAEAEVVWERRGAVSPLAKARRQAAGRKIRVSR
jgi:tRNA threonylcarbamoyladenosine biosynthesis protein TsaB